MKNMKIWFILLAAILVIGLIGSVFVLQKPESNMVEIVQDREVLYRLDLSVYEETETIEIKCDNGTNIVLIENGQICMSHADCPDQTCVKMGWLHSAAPIVCLPHHLVIQYADDMSEQLDGMAK